MLSNRAQPSQNLDQPGDDWTLNLGKGNAYEWVGWAGKTAEVDFKFPKARLTKLVRLGLDNYISGGVYEPTQVDVLFSNDGVTWSTAQVYKLSDSTLPAILAGKRGDITLNFSAVTAQWLKVRFYNSSWTFLDEVAFD